MRRHSSTLGCKGFRLRRECSRLIAIIDYGMGNLHSVSKAVERLGGESVITSDREVILTAAGAILPGVGAFGDAMKYLRETGLDGVTKEYAATGKPLFGICLGMQLLFSGSEEGGSDAVGQNGEGGSERAVLGSGNRGNAGSAESAESGGSRASVGDMGGDASTARNASAASTGSTASTASYTSTKNPGGSVGVRGLNLLSGRVVRFVGDYKIPQMGWNRLKFRRQSPLLEAVEEGYVYFVHSYHVLVENTEDVIATTDYYQDVTSVVERGNIYGTQFHPEKSGPVGMKLLENFLRMAES